MNFDYHSWETSENADLYVVPALNDFLYHSRRDLRAPDAYRPSLRSVMHRSGKRTIDLDRSKAIQASRGRKRADRNVEFFFSNVLPVIESHLDEESWKNLSYKFPERTDFKERAGLRFYRLGDRTGWARPEEAEKRGAVLIETPEHSALQK